VRWHRAGFRCYWRWKSRPLGGRPQIETKLRALIRRMSMENPLWGCATHSRRTAQVGFEVAQSSVAKYMVNGGGRPARMANLLAQPAPASRHGPVRCSNYRFSTCSMPSSLSGSTAETSSGSTSQQIHAEWVARQITEAFPWDELRATSSAIATGSMQASSRADCAPWASGTNLPHQPRPAEWLCERLIGSDPAV